MVVVMKIRDNQKLIINSTNNNNNDDDDDTFLCFFLLHSRMHCSISLCFGIDT